MTKEEHIARLVRVIDDRAYLLKSPHDLNPLHLLIAIAGVESSYGVQNVPKYESAYAPGGLYYRRAKYVRDQYWIYGALSCCSYSSWQILYLSAYDLGCRDHPLELWKDEVAIEWVVKYLNVRVFGRGAKRISEIADAYNSGTHRDDIVPYEYIAKLEDCYAEAGVILGR